MEVDEPGEEDESVGGDPLVVAQAGGGGDGADLADRPVLDEDVGPGVDDALDGGGGDTAVDLEAEMALGRVLLALSEAEGPGGEPLVRAAHDCSTGGLIQTLVDSCLRCGVGASVDLTAIQEEGVDDFTALFSESGARAIVAVREELVPAVTAAAEAEDVAVARLGTTGGDLLVVAGSDLLSDGGAGRPLVLDLAELGADVEGVLPALF